MSGDRGKADSHNTYTVTQNGNERKIGETPTKCCKPFPKQDNDGKHQEGFNPDRHDIRRRTDIQQVTKEKNGEDDVARRACLVLRGSLSDVDAPDKYVSYNKGDGDGEEGVRNADGK